MAKADRLVVVAHFEPPPEEEMAEILSRVYRRLISDALLTRHDRGSTVVATEGDNESSEIRQGQHSEADD